MNAVIKETRNQIVEFNEFESQLQEFKEKYDDVVYDLTVPEQWKQARSDKHSIGKVLSKLDAAHKTLKAPLKEKVDLIDSRRKEIKDQLLEVQGKIKGQIDLHEKTIEEHAGKLQSMVDEISLLSVFEHDKTGMPFSPDLKEIRRRISILGKIKVDDSFEDRKADGTLAHVEIAEALNSMLAKTEEQEAKDAALEKSRIEKEERERKEREEKIRQDAESKATQEAEEKAERDKKEAAKAAQKEIDDANQEKEEAKQRALDAAQKEREKIECEQAEKERREQVERDKTEAKKAKKKHRKRIQNEAVESLAALLIKEDIVSEEKAYNAASEIVDVIDAEAIHNVSINY